MSGAISHLVQEPFLQDVHCILLGKTHSLPGPHLSTDCRTISFGLFNEHQIFTSNRLYGALSHYRTTTALHCRREDNDPIFLLVKIPCPVHFDSLLKSPNSCGFSAPRYPAIPTPCSQMDATDMKARLCHSSSRRNSLRNRETTCDSLSVSRNH
ncbi:hypothetical protein TNCV_1121131 [Trichonephila clavipes]|uniref:Uncharacterized protein n=1 Tax=Trichonephila clavipes TaxID=2585209 RepID=A0A8X6SVP3_TRICX|nr:hypothetical protein TNCV_1121131 [Trichonephila clavipes]